MVSFLGVYSALFSLSFQLLLAVENRLVFPGAEREDRYARPKEYTCEDVWITMDKGTKIHGVWCAPPGWKPTDGALLFCHGNGGNVSYRYGAMYMWVKYAGQGVLLFDYPGYGKSEGAPTEASCCQSADAAYDWLQMQRKIDGNRILIYGGSLGGGVAVDLASRKPHRALVLVSTFTSIPDLAQTLLRFPPVRALVHTQFDNLAKIKKCRQPTLVVHSKADGLIPYSMGERLYTASPAPKQFFSLEKDPHHDSGNVDAVTSFMAFLKEQESKRKADAGKKE